VPSDCQVLSQSTNTEKAIESGQEAVIGCRLTMIKGLESHDAVSEEIGVLKAKLRRNPELQDAPANALKRSDIVNCLLALIAERDTLVTGTV